MNLIQVTRAMLNLEKQINIQQGYIARFGAENDKNPDKQWEQYKATAALYLNEWDSLKAKRDQLKAA